VNFIEIGPDVPALRDAFVDGRSQAFMASAANGAMNSQQIIAQGSDVAYMRQLRSELKR
jgi:hypothetical protein